MPRIPLGPLDTNRVYNRELTPYLRGHIISLKAEGHMPEAIDKKINILSRPGLQCGHMPRHGNSVQGIGTGFGCQEVSWVSRGIQKGNSVDYVQLC